MRIRMKIGAGIILLLLLNMYVVLNSSAQPPPLVYDVENTGVDCTRPPLPTFAELPIVEPLTDPFEWSDGSGRDTTFASWVRRRNEIKCEIENYEIGPKPVRPDTISASFANDTLTVNITKNGVWHVVEKRMYHVAKQYHYHPSVRWLKSTGCWIVYHHG